MAADALEVDVEALETPEMKALLDDRIWKHFDGEEGGNGGKGGNEKEEDEGTEAEEAVTDSDASESATGAADGRLPADDLCDGEPAVKDRKPAIKGREPATKGREPAAREVSAPKARPTKRARRQGKEAPRKKGDQLASLKAYVFKCGVRKAWKRELEGLSEKQSIDRVRRILEELGMEGRPSLEKCRKIREQREYAEEIRAIGTGLVVESRLRPSRTAPAAETSLPKEPPSPTVPRLNLALYGDAESD